MALPGFFLRDDNLIRTFLKEVVLMFKGNAGPWVAFVRIFLGVFWLYEVTIGHNWKIGSFTSGPHPGWFGPEAGSYLIEQGNAGIAAGTWSWFAWVLETLMYPNAALWGYVAVAVQIMLALAFIFGLFVRPMAVIGLSMDFFIFMLGNSRIPPFFSIGHLFVLATNAGMYYGLDAYLVNRYDKEWLKKLINLNFFPDKARYVAGSAAAVLAVYYLQKTTVIDTEKIKMVSLDLGILFGFVAAWFFLANDKMNKIDLTTSLLRIWLGYRFLHEIFVRNVPALNGIPGWGTKEQLTAVFTQISELHWPAIGFLMDSVFIPTAGFWAIFFAVIHTAVAIMLLLGIRTRIAAKIGLGFLALLIVLGFTRYSPFMFGYLFAVLALDGGRMFSFDSLNGIKHEYGINISRKAILSLAILSVVAAVVAYQGGVLPDGYRTSMGPVVAAMVAMLAGLVATGGVLQESVVRIPVAELEEVHS